MKDLFNKLMGGLSTEPGGFSARKMSAFVVMICIVIAHISWLKHAFMKEDYHLLGEILMIDFGFVSVALGLTTYETITKMKNGNNSNTPPSESSNPVV